MYVLHDPPTVAEVEKALAALAGDMAPGYAAMPEDVYKAVGICRQYCVLVRMIKHRNRHKIVAVTYFRIK